MDHLEDAITETSATLQIMAQKSQYSLQIQHSNHEKLQAIELLSNNRPQYA